MKKILPSHKNFLFNSPSEKIKIKLSINFKPITITLKIKKKLSTSQLEKMVKLNEWTGNQKTQMADAHTS